MYTTCDISEIGLKLSVGDGGEISFRNANKATNNIEYEHPR